MDKAHLPGEITSPASPLVGILDFACELGASDIHLCAGAPLMIRLHGDLVKMSDYADGLGEDFTPADIETLLAGIMSSDLQRHFSTSSELDFSINLTAGDRCRANLFRNIFGASAVFRIVPSKIPELEKLGVPAVMQQVVMRSKGLVLVTGPTGSGKSTTLAALIDFINRKTPKHIITIEDPVEFVHPPKQSLINQREIGKSASNFMEALRGALREDPDVILIGEMRDLDTIQMAITAAETGHLVFGTLHTMSAAKTVDRVIGEFPADRQNQVRMQLAESLSAVISQILLPRGDQPGRVAAFEVLISTPAVHNLIRENKTYQISTVIQTGTHLGMIGMDQSLMLLVNAGLVAPAEARKYAGEPKMFPDRAPRAKTHTNVNANADDNMRAGADASD
ncbi:MAG: type IV pilus twitching motility protein PilT [Calditrichaeota bacterium]|nr:type IV pilus twitching motility protein PilT [Calditrichota bacterium]